MGELDRIRWRCRRGMLELDIAIGQFFDRHFEALPKDDQSAFLELLDEQDQDILDWLYAKSEPKSVALKRIITILIEHAAE